MKPLDTQSVDATRKMDKKILIEIKLVPESQQKTNQEIINEIYADIMEGRCVIPYCQSVLKIIKI
jgi:hypothetical protein